MTHARIAIATAALAAAVLLGPGTGTASAQTPATSQYSGDLGQTAHNGSPAAGNAGPTLPFTGADLGPIAGTGAALIGAGVLLRTRAARRAER
jgi:hypothetical protein